MSFYETHFSQYLDSITKFNLHPSFIKLYETFYNYPSNIIFYGPQGIGKYSQAILLLSYFSPSNLKYEKKISITMDKNEYIFKISDIHIEIDFAILGCNSKIIWNEFFEYLNNIVCTNNYSRFFILTKNFNIIYNELHDVFYSYLQTATFRKYKLFFIMLAYDISFIHPSIMTSSYILFFKRPSKNNYNKITDYAKNTYINNIISIKALKANISIDYNSFTQHLFNMITSRDIDFFEFRNILYNILIYNIDLHLCIWDIVKKFSKLHKNCCSIDYPFLIFNFYLHFNNNYRPIYHLELFFVSLINEHQRCLQNPTNIT